jgi:hypothetical protein
MTELDFMDNAKEITAKHNLKQARNAVEAREATKGLMYGTPMECCRCGKPIKVRGGKRRYCYDCMDFDDTLSQRGIGP